MPIASMINSPLRDRETLTEIHGFKSDSFLENDPTARFRQLTRSFNTSGDGDSDIIPHRDTDPFRRRVGKILHDERFDLFILILIAVNSALYGVATFPTVKENAALISDFEKVDFTILVVFTVESCMNIFYEGKRFVKDGWLMFDLLIVTISWVSIEVKSLQVFRIFRAFRFLTKVEILRNVVVALFGVVPAIAAITVLLLLILYIFSVMYTQLFKDFYAEGFTTADYFGRLDLTLFSLFQIMCLDEWSGIAYEVGEEDYWAWLIFIIFIVMSAFVVVNLIIAVICDALQILRKAERAMLFGLSEEEAGDGTRAPPKDEKVENNHTQEERIQQRIIDMNRMLDEVVASQERMSRTIQYLSIVVESQQTKTSTDKAIKSLVAAATNKNNTQNGWGHSSGVIPAEEKNNRDSRKKERVSNDYDSSYNQSDDRLGASMNSASEVGMDNSFASFASKGRRWDAKHPPKRDEREHSSSLDDSKGIEMHDLHEENDINGDQPKEQDSFNECGDDPVPNYAAKLPSWFHTLNNGRKYIGEKVNDNRVQSFILLLIVINSIMMGIATFPFVKDNPDMSYKFDLADQIFLIIFTVESALQLLYHGWYLFKDGFLVFDLLIVIMSWALEGTQVIRAFRIFRALRLITRIEVMRNLVMALFSVIPKMTAIALLLMLIFFIFGVMMTTLFKNMYPETLSQPYFESLFYSLFTLFQMMTLDEWADILGQVQEVYPWAWAPFIIFIVITGFVVVNLIIAVICDAVHVLGNENKAGLYGYDSEGSVLTKNTKQHPGQIQAASSSSQHQRLEELQQQLDELLMTQDQMRRTIELLASRLTFPHDGVDCEVSQSEGEGY